MTQMVKNPSNEGDLGLIPGLGRSSGGRYGNPLQYTCLENPHGQRSLVGYSPWGHKESDTTEQLSTAHMNTPIWEELGLFPWCPRGVLKLGKNLVRVHCVCSLITSEGQTCESKANRIEGENNQFSNNSWRFPHFPFNNG